MKVSKLKLSVLGFGVIILLNQCKKDGSVTPTPFDNASASRGGMMYDNFWAAETAFDQSNANITLFESKSDFFRCKQCHGWDLKGTLGSYNGRKPNANRPRVAPIDLYTIVQNKTPQEIFDAIKTGGARRPLTFDLGTYDPASNATIGDQMPDYGKILTDSQIWDLVKFLKSEAMDVSSLYDGNHTGLYPNGTSTYANIGKDGVASNGHAIYAAKCVSCHGTDGKLVPDLDNSAGMTVGKFARNKPNEMHHKIKYGQLGTIMTGQFDNITPEQMKDLYKALSDSNIFPE